MTKIFLNLVRTNATVTRAIKHFHVLKKDLAYNYLNKIYFHKLKINLVHQRAKTKKIILNLLAFKIVFFCFKQNATQEKKGLSCTC